ncbi:MAG: hypothetical protein V2J10_04640, partial [Wenzhouxiangella sp.]|nr:hypothetical protein [Wenzhouxiangella sp.]
MKKWLIIVLVLAATIWLAVLPGVVGLVVGNSVEQWLDESAPTAESHFERGWFASRLALADTHLKADLAARHVPPTRPGWLEVSGEVDLRQLPDGGRVDGFMHINGRTRVAIVAPRFLAGVSTRALLEALTLEFEQHPAGHTRIDLGAAGLALANSAGLDLDYAGLELDLERGPVSDTASRLELELRLGESSDPQALALTLTAAPIDDLSFDQLLDGLGQLQRARPDSYDAQLALLTLAGAWAGLANAGLVIELDRLALGESSRLDGRWDVAAGQPRITGGGRSEDLLEFIKRLVSLTREAAPAAAEPEARAWIRTLVERTWLTLEGERFRFAYPSASGGDPSSPGP